MWRKLSLIGAPDWNTSPGSTLCRLSGTFYIGITSDLELRVWQHKTGAFEGFSKKYSCTRFVYREEFDAVFRVVSSLGVLRLGRSPSLRMTEG